MLASLNSLDIEYLHNWGSGRAATSYIKYLHFETGEKLLFKLGLL